LVRHLNGVDKRVSDAVHFHHEREDGSGYPTGLPGEQISLFSTIIAVADTFDAMTANRTYKVKESPFRVFELMQNGCFGYLDPVVLDTFLANISHYYVGYKVRLSDGRIAEVVYINRQQYGRPVLRVDDNYLDMSVAKNVRIEEVL
jgi:HD-GYP domain-containing protein (c-di-GMP phosphodiesterase class II)